MFDYLKKKMPRLYDEYLHIKRLKDIKQAEKYKKMPLTQQIKLLEQLYYLKIGHPLDWDNLQTYTEKMQWEKMFHYDPLKVTLSDKFAVRKWVKNKIGEEYLIPIIGVWNKFDEIDFSDFPNQFVLKTNHGTGTNYVIKDKSKFKIKQARRMFNDWMATDYGYINGFEIHYSEIERKILAEKYLETGYGELQDYKFLCFDGRPYFCWVDMGRYSKHTRNVYDLNWKLQPWNQSDYEVYKEPISKPQNFEEMVRIATILCNGFQHVRVDLYNVDGKIYFGEMTFTNGRGFDRIIPEKYDQMLGDLWNINISK